MKISRKCFTVFIWQTIQKCQLFLRHPVYVSLENHDNLIVCPFLVWGICCTYIYFKKGIETEESRKVATVCPSAQLCTQFLPANPEKWEETVYKEEQS